MSPGPTFDRVYRALKGRLLAAGFAPGENLEPAALGEELHASVTPVRDALHRLAGERLVAAPFHDGFCAASFTEAELRDMFGWSATLIDLALRRARVQTTAISPDPTRVDSDHPRDASELFMTMIHALGPCEHAMAIEGIVERLATVRTVEPAVFDDTAEELAELHFLHASGNGGALRRGVATYHRRRQRAAPDLLAALRRETQRHRRR